jgi:tripartite-type tricarboxylate transporter receptor subunit TctC
MKRRQFCAAASAITVAGWQGVHAQTVDKITRILIGFPPGGTADVIARSLAERLRGSYAPTVLVEHRPGARGVPVMNAVLGAEADGSTLLLMPHAMMTLWPHVYRNLPYDPIRDLRVVAMVATLEFALAVNPSVPARNLSEFLAWCKANPQRALYGTLGPGSSPEFLGFQLSQDAGVKLSPVPYRGSAPGVVDLIGGQTPAWIGPLGDVIQHHAAGKARIIATSGMARSRFLPDVPTFAEMGLPNVLLEERWGVFVRKDTPATVTESLAKLLLEALRHSDYRATTEKITYEAKGATGPQFTAIIQREHERWRRIVNASGYTPE